MRKSILILSAILLLTGCDIQKEVSKREKQTSITESWEQTEKRPSAPVLYNPPANVILRDTTIVVVNSEGTKLTMRYDKEGNMREAECLPALIDLVTKMSKQFEQLEKEKDKKEHFSLDTTFILCLFGGLVIVICFALFLMQRSINKKFEVFTSLSAQNSNK